MNINYIEENSENLDFVVVSEVNELENGERLIVEFDNFSIVVFNVAGKLFAIGDVCSHDDGPIGEGELDQNEVTCPRHGAKFDVSNGHVLTLPAVVDIPAYPVRVSNGKIEVGVPLEA